MIASSEKFRVSVVTAALLHVLSTETRKFSELNIADKYCYKNKHKSNKPWTNQRKSKFLLILGGVGSYSSKRHSNDHNYLYHSVYDLYFEHALIRIQPLENFSFFNLCPKSIAWCPDVRSKKPANILP